MAHKRYIKPDKDSFMLQKIDTVVMIIKQQNDRIAELEKQLEQLKKQLESLGKEKK